MSLQISFDASDLKTLIVGTGRTVQSGTARAVRVALNEGAEYARTHHVHTRRTGWLTSASELRAEMRQADASGAWGYITNYTPYGAYVEYGTKPHKIFPKAAHGLKGPVREGQTRRATGRGPHEHIVGRGLMLRFRVGGQIVFARMVNHPGTAAMPFMQPAAEHAGLVLVRETENVTFALVAKLWD